MQYSQGDVVAIDGTEMTPAEILADLNRRGSRHGVGRADIVENRYVGMKNRGCYETPGGTIMLKGHRAMESITLDREVAHMKDELMPRYAKLIDNGYWFSPEREALQSFMDTVQERVNGEARIKLYKGHASVEGRRSPTHDLYDEATVTFEADEVFDQSDSTGFIKMRALRLRTLAARRISEGE